MKNEKKRKQTVDELAEQYWVKAKGMMETEVSEVEEFLNDPTIDLAKKQKRMDIFNLLIENQYGVLFRSAFKLGYKEGVKCQKLKSS